MTFDRGWLRYVGFALAADTALGQADSHADAGWSTANDRHFKMLRIAHAEIDLCPGASNSLPGPFLVSCEMVMPV